MNKRIKRLISGMLSVIVAGSCAASGLAADVRYGDVNNDSLINSSDALVVLTATVGAKTLTADETKRGDVDGNGIINSSDALDILLYSVGSLKKFKVEDADKPVVPTKGDEILALYSNAVKKARKEIPSYRFKMVTETKDPKIEATGLIPLSDKDKNEFDDDIYNVLYSIIRRKNKLILINKFENDTELRDELIEFLDNKKENSKGVILAIYAILKILNCPDERCLNYINDLIKKCSPNNEYTEQAVKEIINILANRDFVPSDEYESIIKANIDNIKIVNKLLSYKEEKEKSYIPTLLNYLEHEKALEKAHKEYDKYMRNHLTQAEKDYLEIMGEDIKKLK